MKLVYFAWVRERVGKAEEELAPPQSVATVTDLIEWLSGRGEEYAHAFCILRLASRQQHWDRRRSQ